MSSHNGRGANPPALLHMRANPVGILRGSCGSYTELIPADDAFDSRTAGTLRPVLRPRDDCDCDGVLLHELATMSREREDDAPKRDIKTARIGTAPLGEMPAPSLDDMPLLL